MSATPTDSAGPVPPGLDFSRLWRSGQVRGVEDYLARRYPDGAGLEDLLDLIQHEILLREAAGEVPDPAVFQRRFPDHADQVGALFAVNHLLSAPAAGGPGGNSTAPAVASYEVGESLGRGGTGEVFRATDVALGRPIAVKVLRPEWRDDPAAVGRFLGEARITARLQHPGVPPLYEVGYDERKRPFIAMKLVEGRTLARLLADRASPADDLPRLLHVFEQVCQTVAYAHSRRVIHRDLKPANVMVGEFGEVQVMDWGLAKQLTEEFVGAVPEAASRNVVPGGSTAPPDGLTRVGHLIGTPAYAPPEQARGEHDRVGPASDVFGLGALLCEVLTGRPPFDTTEQARTGDVAPARARLLASGADAELVAMALTCLAPDPGDRPADATAVGAAVDGYQVRLRERLRAAELAEARATAERKTRRRTEALRLIGVAVAVAAGVGVWAWSRWQTSLARDVTAALDEGRTAREEMVRVGGDPARLAEAERAARRAEGLLRGVVERDDLRGQTADLITELEVDARDPDVVRRLDEMRLMRDMPEGWSSNDDLDAAYESLFRNYGIDVTALDPGEAARRINGRAVRVALVTALDYWGQRCLTRPPLHARGRHLLAVARAADPDPWRNRLRDALSVGDTRALVALAGEAPAADLPISTLVELGTLAADQSFHGDGAKQILPPRPEGVAVLREARRRAPGDFWANYHLAAALNLTWAPQNGDEAVLCAAVAVAIRPDLVPARWQLAFAYWMKGDWPAEVGVLRDAVAVAPGRPEAHIMLGLALVKRGEIGEAVTSLRKAVDIDPNNTLALIPLSFALAKVGAWDESVAAFERAPPAVRGAPEYAAVCADHLIDIGRPDTAVEGLRLAHQRLQHRLQATNPANPAGKFADQRASWLSDRLREAERMADLSRRLPGVEDGTVTPQAPAEWWDYVRLCYATRRDLTAVRLAERAPSGRPAKEFVMDGPEALWHVNAAARAAGAPGIDPAERTRCRGLALTWLRAELARWSAEAQTDDPKRWFSARKMVRIWQQHRDLAPVRDPAALAALPETEQAAWTTFWRDVEDFVHRIDAVGPSAGGQPVVSDGATPGVPASIPLAR